MARAGAQRTRCRPSICWGSIWCAAWSSTSPDPRRPQAKRRPAACAGHAAAYDASPLGRLTPGAQPVAHRPTLDRVVALDGDAVARARGRPVVPHGAVLDAAIVPERDRIRLPAETALEQRVLGVIEQIAQHAGAFVARHADQAL